MYMQMWCCRCVSSSFVFSCKILCYRSDAAERRNYKVWHVDVLHCLCRLVVYSWLLYSVFYKLCFVLFLFLIQTDQLLCASFLSCVRGAYCSSLMFLDHLVILLISIFFCWFYPCGELQLSGFWVCVLMLTSCLVWQPGRARWWEWI